METESNNQKTDFHAVEFMRQVRSELTEQFLKDQQQYLNYLHQVMADFKKMQRGTTHS